MFARGGILGIADGLLRKLKAGRAKRDRRARNPRAVQELRRAHRGAEHRLPARGRRAPRADRPQRRRQDHLRQHADRRARALRPARSCSAARTSRACPGRRACKRGLGRTFQINTLFRGLTVLDNVALGVAERAGLAARMWRPASALQRGQGREPGAARAARPRRRRAARRCTTCPTASSGWSRSRSRSGLKPRVLLLDEPAAGVPSLESGRILKVLDELPARHRDPDHRARHGPGVPLRAAHHRAGAGRGAGRGHAGGDRRRPARARGLSRRGRAMADALAAREGGCAPATARPSSSRTSPSRCPSAARSPCSAATAWARPRCSPPSWATPRSTRGSIVFARQRDRARCRCTSAARLGIGYVPQAREIFPSLIGRGEPHRRRAPGPLDAGAGLRPVPAPGGAAQPHAATRSPAASSRCSPSAAR